MNNELIFAMGQLCSSSNIKTNLLHIEQYAQLAKSQQAQVLFLPENALWMGEPDALLVAAKSMVLDKTIADLQSISKKNELPIHLGSYPELHEGTQKCFNTSLWINADGFIVSKYRKIHLFDVQTPSGEVYAESKNFLAGSELTCLDQLGFKWGMSICFDLRFPEQFRALSEKKAEIFLIPSAFTFETGKAHWQVLMRARAIENFAYVIAAAQTGVHENGRKTFGHSMVVNPWGEVVFEAGAGESLYMAAIPRDEQQKELRQRFKSTQKVLF